MFDDFDELICLWEVLVCVIYYFIFEVYIQKLKLLVWSVYFYSMLFYMICDNVGIEGFMGINGIMFEMFFVYLCVIGMGIGK